MTYTLRNDTVRQFGFRLRNDEVDKSFMAFKQHEILQFRNERDQIADSLVLFYNSAAPYSKHPRRWNVYCVEGWAGSHHITLRHRSLLVARRLFLRKRQEILARYEQAANRD